MSKRKAPQSSGRAAAPPIGKRFRPGESGNPGGRPKTDPEFIEACRARTPKALGVLDEAMDNFALSPASAVKAAEVMLNRGWGTAPATIKLDVKGEVSTAIEVRAVPVDPERLRRIAGVLRKAGVLEALQAEVPKVEET